MVFEIRAGVDSLALPAGPWARWRPVVIASFDGPEAFTALQQSLADSTGDASGAGADYDGAAGLARLRTALETVESAATEDRSAWDAAGAFLDANAMQLAPRLGAGLGQPRFAFSGGPAIPVLRRWTETELAQVLSSEALRRELFDESPTVSIDLDEFAVAWRDRAGRRRSRPLEAFSSGEQVFAYTRAKLEEIAESGRSIDSTVLVLDEFGAFVARDRFGQLLQYVEDDALGRIADQVVVMLPLSAGAALAGSEAEAELESRSYFAVPGMELA